MRTMHSLFEIAVRAAQAICPPDAMFWTSNTEKRAEAVASSTRFAGVCSGPEAASLMTVIAGVLKVRSPAGYQPRVINAPDDRAAQ